MLRRNLLFAAGCLLAAFASDLPANEAVNWAPSLQAAVGAASRQNQLVLIHFWAPNCPPCRALEQNVFNRDDVAQAISRDFVPVKINAATMPDLARKYGVDRWPMDVIVTPAGYAVHKMVSPQDPREYMQSLYRVAADRHPGRGLTSAEPTGPDRSLAMGGGAVGADNRFAANTPYQNNQYQPGPAASPWGAEAHPQAQNPSAQGLASRFSPPVESRTSNYGGSAYAGGDNRFSDDSSAQPYVGRNPGEQVAPFGQPYANPYAPEQGAGPQESRFAPPQSTGQYAPPQGASDRWGDVPTAQDARNAYASPSREGSPADNGGPAPQQQYSQPQQPQQPFQPPVQPTQAPRADGPPLGLEGYCPVTLVEQTRWQRGDARFGIIHRGRLYLFPSDAEKQTFWKDPDLYAPVLSGNDPVAFAESGQLIQGNRRHGVFFRNQIYLFTSEESLQRFWNTPERYAETALQAMRRPERPMR